MSNVNVGTGGTSVGISHSKRGIACKLVEGSSTGIRSVTAIGSNGNERRISCTKDGIGDDRRSSQSRELIHDNRINGNTTVSIGDGHRVKSGCKPSNVSGCSSTRRPSIGVISGTSRNTDANGSIGITRSGRGRGGKCKICRFCNGNRSQVVDTSIVIGNNQGVRSCRKG